VPAVLERHAEHEVGLGVERLGSEDARVRETAARELGAMGSRAAAAQSALEDALADTDGDVCLAASDALSKIRKEAH